MATKPSDAVIKAYLEQNILNPAAVAEAVRAHGLTLSDLSRVSGARNEQVMSYFLSNEIDISGIPAITSNEAAELLRRSQVGGVATSEFNAAGGYEAVKEMAKGNTTGYQYGVRTVADMAKYAPNDAIVRFDPAGQGGLGETFYASGNSATGGKALTPTPVTPTPVTPMPTPTPIVGKATGSATTTPGSITQLNAPILGGGGGLITGANTLAYTPGTFNIGNTATGNVNAGGLISGAQQQMFTENAQVGLPTGVTPSIGAMGNNTGGASIAPYNPYKFTGTGTATGASQNWYNPKTGQRYTALPGYSPPSADWVKA